MKLISKERQELRWIIIREFTRHIMINSIKNMEIASQIENMQEKKAVENDEQMFMSPKTKLNQGIFQKLKRKELDYKYVKPMQGLMDMGKLNIIISDPRVKEIDCYGPNRELLVRMGNSTQKARINLSKEEIDGIIENFSTKAKIPLVKGIFKAALGNLILTAFISDFVETKFTIQKRNPFEPLVT